MKTTPPIFLISSLLFLLSGCSVPVSTPTAIPTAIPLTASPTTNPPPFLGTQSGNNTSGSDDAPVILLLTGQKGSYGDIYTWNGASQSLKQLTSWGYNFAPRVSPDGKWLAYLSISQAAVSAMIQEQAVNADDLANIWLLDPYTEEAIQITEQPQNATYASGNLIGRGAPVWSPDGASIAWIEDDAHGERVAIYTLSSKSTTTFPLVLPPGCCEGAGADLYWGRSGITIANQEGTPFKSEGVIYIFDTQGRQLAKLAPGGYFFLQYGWITDGNNHEYLGVDVSGVLTVVDPFGIAQPVTPQGYPEMYSPIAPEELSIHPAKNPGLWTITRHGQSLADINDIKDATDISIAPDGQGIVYRPNVEGEDLPGDKLFAYLINGQTVPVIIPQSLRVLDMTWGATAWRIHN
jgi:hypothetical protein